MTGTDIFLKLWGKTDRTSSAVPDNFHPLLFHLLDVAYCAEELWDTLPAALQERMAQATGLDTAYTRTLFILLAGLHDLGKAYPYFQNKVPKLLANLQDEFDFPTDGTCFPHNFVSVPEVERLFQGTLLFEEPFAPEIARVFAYALGAHHGVFPKADDMLGIQGRNLGEKSIWQEARNWLAESLMDAFPDSRDTVLPVDCTVTRDRVFAPLLAGFISLADWFGSSKYFAIHGVREISAYREEAKQSANEALKQSGWTAPPDKPDKADFQQLFGYLNSDITPNALQKKVMEMQREVRGTALWIIEEEMGAGKTEAAFSIFDQARVNDQAHGVYIAMPTQATSNAMHQRLGDFLRNRHPDKNINLVLAHSHATLDSDYRERMKQAETLNGAGYSEDQDGEEGMLIVQSWFTHSKQTLLAHYGVGTIDQALLGVLQTRHWFVRLFGLARKVVVFDEIHAYDAYMNTLLLRLIEWLAELDCTVVLLSATLPRSTRMKLANAYAKGAKGLLEEPENKAKYPRITLVQRGEEVSARAVEIVKSPEPEPKRVALSHLPNTPEAVKTALLEAIPGEGCAIVVCNTVTGAQTMYAALKAELGPQGWDCQLFHARTPFVWRKEKEECVLKLFGKESGDNRTMPRQKTLLVATQVVEQSLDLDADFMASELAPVDLVLQRMGRLWRHKRARTATEPHFALLTDTNVESGLPIFGNSGKVYAPHTLLRSWLALKDRSEIVLPTDIEPLVTAVYDAPDPEDVSEEIALLLEEARLNLKTKQNEQRDHAAKVSVQIQKEGLTFSDWLYAMKPTLLDDDDPETHQQLRALTRDGAPSLTIVLCGTDEHGETLAPQPAGSISAETAQGMMKFSLPVSQIVLGKAFEVLKSERPPANWQKSSHLRHCRRAILEGGTATIAGLRFTLTEEKGLKIEKE